MTIFKHIYIEEKAADYAETARILELFPDACRVYIRHYKDVFNRRSQNFQLQKEYRKLILAVREGGFIYDGPEICQNFGHSHFYYSSVMYNCIYNCDYCYLQGLYPSANIVAFVNTGDFLEAASSLCTGAYLTVSYDTDLLAFEGIIPYTSMWIGFGKENPDKTVEIRTKSANYGSISQLQPVQNVVLAWTLSPAAIAEKYEKGAPPPAARLNALNRAIADGWRVRLCFDPLLMVTDWKGIYGAFIKDVFTSIPHNAIQDVSIGSFRMNSQYLKKIGKTRYDSDILYYPFETKNGVAAYPEAEERKLAGFVFDQVSCYIDGSKVYL